MARLAEPSVITPLLLALAVLGQPLRQESFRVAQPSEAVAVLTASCERCAWGRKGREAAALSLSVDGRYSQHLLLLKGAEPAEYRVALGPLAPGTHRLSVSLDREASAAGVRRVGVSQLEILTTPQGAGEYAALAFAPRLHPSVASAQGFVGVPLLLWYESEPTPRGRRIRYSAILSGAGPGTPVDRLMAVWGRATDILFVYAVELDAAGRVLGEEFAGPGGTPTPFTGGRDGRHPLLWLTADGGLAERGETTSRHAPAPFAFGFVGAPREAVMDANPWTYRVMIQEVARRGLLVADARQGSGRIPDPRRFAYVEACGELKDAALSLEVGTARGDKVRWRASDEGGPEFRIARSGCFRGAVALGSSAGSAAIRALRFRAFARPGDTATERAGARLDRVSRLFVLGPDGTPGPNLFSWEGRVALRAGDAPYTLQLPDRR